MSFRNRSLRLDPLRADLPPGGFGPRNGQGTTAMFVGVLGILAALLVPPAGLVLGILALVLGLLGWRKARAGLATNGGQAMIGLLSGTVSLVIGLVYLVLTISFVSGHPQAAHQLAQCLSHASTTAQRNACENAFHQQTSG